MIVNDYVNIQDDRLVNGLPPVIKMMSAINASDDSTIVLDFSKTQFISPVFALSLLVYLHSCGKEIQILNQIPYMQTIFFAEGFRPDTIRRTEFLAMMEKYSRKTYIPIVNFPASDSTDDTEYILSTVESLIIRQLNIDNNVAWGLKYIISEMISNIAEHSESSRGYIFAQSYPKKGYLDICIADTGITLLKSYMKLPHNEIASDLEAIQAANRGISSKNFPDAENRGYGIYTTKKMIVEGLQGQYLMISGSALYMKNETIDNFFRMPLTLRWNGTIIALRIPYQKYDFNYRNYLE